MKTREFAYEMREAFAAMRRSDFKQLADLGIPEVLVDHFQMVGVARIKERNGLYFPDPRGRLAFITPVCVDCASTPETPHPDVFPFIGNLIDLIAWDERMPDQWRLRTGAAKWLGAIPPQYMDPRPFQIWQSPLEWLQQRCEGLVPLNNNPAQLCGITKEHEYAAR